MFSFVPWRGGACRLLATHVRRNWLCSRVGAWGGESYAAAFTAAATSTALALGLQSFWCSSRGGAARCERPPSAACERTLTAKLGSVDVRIGEPVPFETPLFKGEALLLLRDGSDLAEPFFELQVQGCFATDARLTGSGWYWFGAELLGDLSMHWSYRWIYEICLRCTSMAYSGSMHYSFGWSSASESELPSIAFPIDSLETVIATPPGGRLPVLGSCLPKTSCGDGSLGPAPAGVRWTISYSNAFLDLRRWRVRFPGVPGGVDLRQFWGDAPLRICAYWIAAPTAAAAADLRSAHAEGRKQYLFAMDLRHAAGGDRPAAADAA